MKLVSASVDSTGQVNQLFMEKRGCLVQVTSSGQGLKVSKYGYCRDLDPAPHEYCLRPKDVKQSHVNSAKKFLKGEFPDFVMTDLFVLLSQDVYVNSVCDRFDIPIQNYNSLVVSMAKGQIANSNNWPEWVD